MAMTARRICQLVFGHHGATFLIRRDGAGMDRANRDKSRRFNRRNRQLKKRLVMHPRRDVYIEAMQPTGLRYCLQHQSYP